MWWFSNIINCDGISLTYFFWLTFEYNLILYVKS